jgi:hypothetical protein
VEVRQSSYVSEGLGLISLLLLRMPSQRDPVGLLECGLEDSPGLSLPGEDEPPPPPALNPICGEV